jgi:hypothetical protein
MNSEASEKFFKSSARSAGSRLYKEAKVSFSKPSALEVLAYIKPNYKVGLKLESMQSKNIVADCNCPQSKKGELCKHIWAAFMAVFEKSPDFFESANEVTKKNTLAKETPQLSEAQINSKAAFKLKQQDYRKEQYQKQKLRAKEFKNKKKISIDVPVFPPEVQKAILYFSKNGFSFEDLLNEDVVCSARKKLSRVFHPDVGGTHAESLELNGNSEILLKYLSQR